VSLPDFLAADLLLEICLMRDNYLLFDVSNVVMSDHQAAKVCLMILETLIA